LTPVRAWRDTLAATVRLAAPIVVVQLGWMAMSVVDTLMVGRVSAEALAAVALGSLYGYGGSVLGMGILLALDPLVAQAVGARDEPAIARALQRGIALALLIGVPATLLGLPAAPVLRLLRQDDAVVPLAASYIWISFLGVVPVYLFFAFRQTLQAMHRLTPVVATMGAANLANVVLNWAFIFGHLGAPALGVTGAAVATTISRWLMAGLLAAAGWRILAPHLRPWHPDSLTWRPLLAMVRLGLPIGVQMQLEFGAFGIIGLLMGTLGAVPMAGHQVALNLASVTFMVPLGVSSAAAVLVGQAVGRGDPAGARRAAAAALACGVGFMSASAGVMLLVPHALASLYTSQAEVLAMAAVLIPLAGLFQVFDGIQVVSIGILRGVGDTRTPMVVNVLGFWLAGLPVSWWLGLRAGQGPVGLWWGLTMGLIVVALFLLWRVRWRLAGSLTRVHVDARAPAA
jgi:MATE family multidrug resistance protein